MDADRGKEDNREHRERLRQKFLTAGMAAFHEYEAVEFLLTCAIPRRDVKPQAKALLRKFGSLRGIVDAEIGDLERISGVGKKSAIIIKFIKEFAAFYLMQKAKEKPQIACTSELLDFVRMAMGGKKDEEFLHLASSFYLEFSAI